MTVNPPAHQLVLALMSAPLSSSTSTIGRSPCQAACTIAGASNENSGSSMCVFKSGYSRNNPASAFASRFRTACVNWSIGVCGIKQTLRDLDGSNRI